MLNTPQAYGGMVTSPHHLASQAGLQILRAGGNAVEAMVAAAAAIAVVYPHMNGLGGDNFWLIAKPGQAPIGIDACGGAAQAADLEFYAEYSGNAIPARGPQAALTVAGAVAGWAKALGQAGGKLPLAELLAPAIAHAKNGVPVPQNLAGLARDKAAQMGASPGWHGLFDGIQAGTRLRQPLIAATLERLADAGLDDFYRGDLARSMAADLAAIGSPLARADLAGYHAAKVEPLALRVAGHDVFNMPPPTQGLASLMILGLFERVRADAADGFDYVHRLVEAAKCAFKVRDAEVGDPAYMTTDPKDHLTAASLDRLAGGIDFAKASPWPAPANPGDTVWLGVIDGDGMAVSMIQSLYWEFGSGCILPQTGVMWQNRGSSFSLDPNHHNCLQPGRKPFHTIQPAMALLDDGRHMVYGTMGGEGQPQTQAMMFTRHVMYGQPLQQAVTAPRWLLGRTWGETTTTLKLEENLDPAVIEALRLAGHEVEIVPAFHDMMGHGGAIIRHPDGLLEGAADPRSDGAVAAL